MPPIDLNQPPYRATQAVVRPTGLVTGTLLARDLAASRRFYEDMLGLECAPCGGGRMLARSRQARPGSATAPWVLEIRQSDTIANPQRMLHHWGIDLTSKAAVDQMNQRLKANKEGYAIGTIHEPQFQHGSYAFYFSDLDSNWWEFQFVPPARYGKKYETGDIA